MMRTTMAWPGVIAGAMSLSLACHDALAEASVANNPTIGAAPSHPVLPPAPWNRMNTASDVEGRIDPLIFFDELVARYRGLTAYSDQTRIIQVKRYGEDETPERTETHVKCELADGKLSVLTPAAQVRRSFGLGLPLSPEMEQAKLGYQLWLLPHMALKFTEKPLEELREGVPEGFTATDAVAVTIDDRPMVHLELTSGDGLSGDYNARFDVYVDPESMLIERIEGRQRTSDGGDYETTYHINPTMSAGGEPVRPLTVSPSTPQTTQPSLAEPAADELPPPPAKSTRDATTGCGPIG